MSQTEIAEKALAQKQAGIGHNAGPPLEELSRIYNDIPGCQSIAQWCQSVGIHRSGFYNLRDKPQTIKVGRRQIITRLAHLRWLQRRLAEAEVA